MPKQTHLLLKSLPVFFSLLHWAQKPCNGWLANRFSQQPSSSKDFSRNRHTSDTLSIGGSRFVWVLLPWFAETQIQKDISFQASFLIETIPVKITL